MLEIELIHLIHELKGKKCESNFIELKSAHKGCPKLFDTFSSFSNQAGGGIIIFGIDENKNYEVCGVYDPADLQKKIMEQSFQMEPNIRPLCTVAKIEEKIVVCAEIQEIDNNLKPCFYKGAGRLKGSYIRVADGDRLMNEYEVYNYEAFKKKIQDELRIAPRAVLEDIKTSEFFRYIQELKIKKPNLSKLSKNKICRLQGFTDSDYTAPTLAGVLLFSDYPQAFFPQLCITAVALPGNEMKITGDVGERFIDNKRIDGTIPQMLEEALAFVRRNMREKTIIDPATGQRTDKPEYPIVAVREIILNALLHRDYSIHTEFAPVTIKMFRDRLEIENPGGLYGRMTLDLLGKISADTRNPFLANALEVLGKTENRYSGIPTILAEMEKANLPAPKFENEHGIFRVTLFNEEIKNFENIEQEIINFCKTPKSRLELIEHFNKKMTIAYIMRKYIQPMIAAGKIQLTMPECPKSKNQKYVTVTS